MTNLKFCLAFLLSVILSGNLRAQNDTLIFKNGVTWYGITTGYFGSSIDFVRQGASTYRADIAKIQQLRGPNAARIMSKEAYAFLAGRGGVTVVGDEFINSAPGTDGLDGVFVRGRRAYNADYTLRGRVSYKDWLARNNSISINSGFSHGLGAFSDFTKDFMTEQGSGASFGWLVSINFEAKLTNSLAVRGLLSSGNNGLSVGVNNGVQIQNKSGWLDFSGFNLGLSYQKDLFPWIQTSIYAMGGYGHYKYIIETTSVVGNDASRNIESGAHAFQYILGSELRFQYSKRRPDYLKAGAQFIGSQPVFNFDFRSANTNVQPSRSVSGVAKPFGAVQLELGFGTYF